MFAQLDLFSTVVDNQGVPVSYLTVDEAAERLGVGRQYVYDAIKRGQLKAVKDPETRTWLVSEESVTNFQRPRPGRSWRRKPSG